MIQQPYFYDAQLRKILIQFSRIFGVFKVSSKNSQGIEQLISIPVIYGGSDRQALHMINGNSENTVQSVPKIAVSFDSIDPGAFKGRSSYQGNSDRLLVTERKFDQNTNSYTSAIGNTYDVERLYPVPVDIKFKVDIWTSNENQKFQIFEQLIILFNPSLDIQTTSSPLDWTALNTVTLESINWNDQGVSRGTDDTPDVLGMVFSAACWINPPSRVKKQTLIHTILQRMGETIEDSFSQPPFSVITLDNHCISVNGSQITLLGNGGRLTDDEGHIYSWPKLIDQYGELSPSSKILLRWTGDITDDTKDTIGTISLHPTIDNILLFNLVSETLPATTLPPVLGFLNPHTSVPSSPVNGDRWIISEEIGSPTILWDSLALKVNDIIEYDAGVWSQVFDAESNISHEFLIDLSTNNLLEFKDHKWAKAINSIYKPGYFRILI